MSTVLKLLMVEDVPSDAEMTLREIQRSGLEVSLRRVETEADLRRECIDFAPDIVLSDFAMPQFDGLSALRIVRELLPHLPFIFVSGTIGEETAIESLRSGANDYVLKTNLPRLPTAIRRAMHDASERTRRLETEEALRLRDRAVEASVNPVLIVSATDPDMPLVYVNRAFEHVTGYSRDEVIGANCRVLQGEDRDQPELDKIRRAISEQCDGQAVLRNYRKDGSLFWNKLYVTPVRDPTSNRVTHFVGVQYDITEIKRYQEELEHQANHDALTGLPNRNLLRDRLTQAVALAQRYKRPFSLTVIDLDNFKLINDSLGHDVGDRLLKIAAERIAACVQAGDTVARFGGDEFVLLVAEQEQEEGGLSRGPAGDGRDFAAVCDRSARVQDHLLDRNSELPARWRGCGHAAAQCRYRDVPCERPRPQQLPALFVRDECRSRRTIDARDGSVACGQTQRAGSALSAQGRAEGRTHYRHGGAAALAPSDQGNDPAGKIHSGRRGKQPHYRDRALGNSRGVCDRTRRGRTPICARCRSP